MHFVIQTPKQKFSGQIFQFLLARLCDILRFSQAHALKCTMQLKVVIRKKIFGQRINFAFMQKIYLLVKKAIWGALCLSLSRFASRVTARVTPASSVIRAVTRDANLLDERQKAPYMAFFTRKSIFCIKAKLILYPKRFFFLL